MKLLIFTQCFPPTHGGIQQLMANLAKSLCQQYDVTVVTDAPPEHQTAMMWDQAQPYTIFRVRGIKWWRQHQKRQLLRQLLNADAHAHCLITDTWKSTAYLAGIAKRTNTPVITHAHGNDVLDKGSAKRKKRMRNAFRLSSQIVAVSHDTANHVRAMNIVNCQVIPCGVETPAPLKSHAHNGSDQPKLLTIARLEPRKGQDQIIRAIAQLKTRWPNIQYTIAGTGKDLPRLQTLVAEKQLNAHIHFVNAVSEAEKATLLAQANLFVMPVRFDRSNHSIEGFGIALVEAQLAGCPVLTGQTGGVTDVVKDGSTGWTCDGSDLSSVVQTLELALSNPEICKRRAQRARAHAQSHFSPEATRLQYLKTIATITTPSIPANG